jgi:hypothetical protein
MSLVCQNGHPTVRAIVIWRILLGLQLEQWSHPGQTSHLSIYLAYPASPCTYARPTSNSAQGQGHNNHRRNNTAISFS